ncbi:hypothetical protein [Propionibacterium australiense]|uniref:ATP/GTP-binding protein n=1 Tax=Propionibacterium australiense TaxID=119981 RepID=A0A8B3FL34_9ACTN|nr:hypothetical protein [Propionibacterium australiense]RLP12148.1 hypothetical protein D7U36_02475 [Propionibacterium australiense]
MARHRSSKHTRPVRPLSHAAYQTSATKRDGRWIIRQIRAGQSTKDYRCPECDQLIAAGTAHVVAWPHTPPIGSTSGLDFRRHFHGSCWSRRP